MAKAYSLRAWFAIVDFSTPLKVYLRPSTPLRARPPQLLSLILKPFFHSVWSRHQLFHFTNCLNMLFISLLEHLHAMLFALFRNFRETVSMKLYVACASKLPASHCLHD